MFTRQIQSALLPYRDQLPPGFLDTLTQLLGNCVQKLEHRGPVRIESNAPAEPTVAVDSDEADQYAALTVVNNAGLVENGRIRHGWALLAQGPALFRRGRFPGGLANPPAAPLVEIRGLLHAETVKPCSLDLSCLQGYDAGQTQLLAVSGGTASLVNAPTYTLWQWDGSQWVAVFSLPQPGYSAIEPTASGSTVGEVAATENMVVTEWHYPALVVNAGSPGEVPWQNPSNAQADDGNYATCEGTDVSGTLRYLFAQEFGFDIPSGATIHGIEWQIARKADGSGGFDNHCNCGSGVGPTTGSNAANASEWSTSEETITYGGPADLHGTSWTPAAINASDFHVRLQSTYVQNLEYAVNFIRCRVYFTL